MYHYLSRSVKKRLMEALKFCYASNPRHKDVLQHIREKYEFSERPQKGIVLQGANSTPMALSSDNYMGTSYSYVMLAQVDEHGGTALEWIKEDDLAVSRANGEFPSAPGVYYIQVEEIPEVGNLSQYQFWVDPLLTVKNEFLLDFVTGTETSATLMNYPVVEDTVKLYAYPDGLLFSGHALSLQAAESLFIGGSPTHLGLGLPEGQVPVTALGEIPGDYVITLGINDTLAFLVNGKSVAITLDPGTLTAEDVRAKILDNLPIDVGAYELDVVVEDNALRLTATTSLTFQDDLVSTASATLGFSAGPVPVTLVGHMAQPHVPRNATFRMVIDGVPLEIELYPGNRPVPEIGIDIQSEASLTSLLVDTVAAGDYSVDPVTGQVTFLRDYLPETQVSASYRYPDASRGPFPIGFGESSNNSAIPGVVLAFGNSLVDGDVMAVVVEDSRSDVADVYGGKSELSVDIDIIARDSMTRSEMADLTTMYLWQWQRERLAEEGIVITSVSFGGESEEPYDDTGDDYYYTASISVSLMSDWEVYIAKPLYIQRLTPTSFDYDARMAAARNGILFEEADLMQVVSKGTLGAMYLVTGTGQYERIR